MSVTDSAPVPPSGGGFDSGAAAFHLFAHARRTGWKPLLGLGAIYFIVWAVASALMLWAMWPFLSMAFDPALPDPEIDPEAFKAVFLPALGSFMFAYTLVMAFYLLFYAVIDAALLRWLFGRGAKLRFGGDELRLIVIGILWWVLPFLVFAAPWLLVFVSVGVGAAAQNGALTALLVLFCFMAFCAAFAVWIWLAARLAPAAAVSIRDGRLRPFGGWGVTAGRFWSVLGAFFIVWVIYLAVSFGAQLVLQPVIMISFADVFASFPYGDVEPDPQMMRELIFSPLMIGAYIASGIFSIVIAFVFQAMLAGANACIAKSPGP